MPQKHGILRRIARRLGIGRLLAETRLMKLYGPRAYWRWAKNRSSLLPLIGRAAPLVTGNAATTEVHMLVHHAKARDGVWAAYSFARQAQRPIQLVIHDDGSLTDEDCAEFYKVLPNARIIHRAEADQRIAEPLARYPLLRSLRERNVLMLKLTDVFLLSHAEHIVYIDSDVLTFRCPCEVLNGEIRYSVDVDNSYALPWDTLHAEYPATAWRCNSGVFSVPQAAISFARLEQAVQNLGLLNEPVSRFVEQTLFAIEFGILNAKPLPATYAICPAQPETGMATAHYCGNGPGGALFYTSGLPWMTKALRLLW